MSKRSNQARKRIIVSSGEKGGVGKSLWTSVLVEHEMAAGRIPLVVEGDLGVADVSARYAAAAQAGAVKLMAINLDKSGSDATNAVDDLFSRIESIGDAVDVIAINLPASGGKVVDSNAELIAEVARGLGYELTVAFLLGPDLSSAELVGRSALMQVADVAVVVINRGLATGDGSRFAWDYADGLREAFLSAENHIEAEMPELVSRAMDLVRANTTTPLHQLASSPDVALVTRSIMSGWMRNAIADSVAPILGEESPWMMTKSSAW